MKRRTSRPRVVLALLCAFFGIEGFLAGAERDGEKVYERRVVLMGTEADVCIRGAADPAGLAEALIRELEHQEARLSTWRPDSVLSRLSEAPPGRQQLLDPPTCLLFQRLDSWVEATGGAFDPLIRPLVEVWGLRSGGRWPGDAEIARARASTGWRRLAFSSRDCTIRPEIQVGFDAGAFGKGEALDRLRDLPAAAGGAWMVSLGGQVLVHDPAGEGWKVTVAHPEDRGRPWLRLRLAGGSLAVSGGIERDLWVDGRRVGHILDPRTGRPAAYDGMVLVWALSALDADILSTACFVMGPAAGTRWAEDRGLAVLYAWRAEGGSGLRILPSSAFLGRFGDDFEPAGRCVLP
ncbi:MAG: FAD:protein FMN transferase [Acidobacteriota bacterium]